MSLINRESTPRKSEKTKGNHFISFPRYSCLKTAEGQL